MNVPDTASYQQLLEVLEDRLWDEDIPDNFTYLVDLVNDLYLKSMEAKIATFSGCCPAYNPGQ